MNINSIISVTTAMYNIQELSTSYGGSMKLDKVFYYLRKSEEELQSQCQKHKIADDTNYKLAMARLYNALDECNSKITNTIR